RSPQGAEGLKVHRRWTRHRPRAGRREDEAMATEQGPQPVRVIWSPEAADDLEQIVHFIARGSTEYASHTAAEVLEAIERAALFPRIGRTVPELEDDAVREVLAFRYRIIYRIKAEAIHVAAIIHGARDLPTALEGRPV